MSLHTNSDDLQAYLSSLPGSENAVVRLTNPRTTPVEIWIEPWGSRLFLLPDREYAIVAAGTDGMTWNSSIIVQLGECVTVWPSGLESNRIFRKDGGLVWDDADPSEVMPYIKNPGVIESLRPLALESGGRTTTMARAELEQILKQRVAHDEWRADYIALLIEHGLLRQDENGLIALSVSGASLLAAISSPG